MNLILIVLFLNSCTKELAQPIIYEAFAQPGFCDRTDEELRAFVIEINVQGFTSGTAVATVLGGRLFVLTNRHNLPKEVAIEAINLRNGRYQYSNVSEIVKLGRDYALEKGLGHARDYALLIPSKPLCLFAKILSTIFFAPNSFR